MGKGAHHTRGISLWIAHALGILSQS